MTNNVKRFPDAYNKSNGSNISKIMELAYGIAAATETDLEDIADSRSIENAYGKTLDHYGKMYGVSRGNADDAQYRTLILTQISRNTVQPDAQSIINAIELMIQTKGVYLEENYMTIDVMGLSTDDYERSGYSGVEVRELISSILPVGVKLKNIYYDGTLMLFDALIPGAASYPQLYSAWLYGQRAYADGREVGLKGHGEVPNVFLQYAPDYEREGDYEGGTLSLILR